MKNIKTKCDQQHEAPVKTVHWIKASTYSCLMTGSWDKTLKVASHFE